MCTSLAAVNKEKIEMIDIIKNTFSGADVDLVVVGSIGAVVIAAVIAIYLGLKIRTLMNSTNSED